MLQKASLSTKYICLITCRNFHFLTITCWNKVCRFTTCLSVKWGKYHLYLSLVFQFLQTKNYLLGLVMRSYHVTVQRFVASWNIRSIRYNFFDLLNMFPFAIICSFCHLRFQYLIRWSKVVIQCGRGFEFMKGRSSSLMSTSIGGWSRVNEKLHFLGNQIFGLL